ncbi:hypothetical protein SDRG_03577 [Saprolegnia diclina VS20]|uniref:Uncharacterized protein n=1 Tax=Saprolegnia diclina (strain VS20) TaxID=1156394 RepID=T0QZ72_SAPDV|nr:hypothetical protein SDRG_03577 [Saprolegnia diclina VS20]EQC39375.1 hypothetical protein SDRG_03577 [Saprolegnia diclina VS20]|eukprot:XP_008607436.1 hypothetical protein SDRG_03577 [Saprolegnia diclina VS20]
MKQALLGTYEARSSAAFFGRLEIYQEDLAAPLASSALLLRYGTVTAPLVPTTEANVVVWTAPFAAQTMMFTLALADDETTTLTGLGITFTPIFEDPEHIVTKSQGLVLLSFSVRPLV